MAQSAQLAGKELAAYTTLAKYLNTVKLWPKCDTGRWPSSVDWILFPTRAGSFDRETMSKPLRDLVGEKVAHYAPDRMGFDDLSLIVYYNLAVIYNSPAETPFFSFEDAAAGIKQLLGGNFGPPSAGRKGREAAFDSLRSLRPREAPPYVRAAI